MEFLEHGKKIYAIIKRIHLLVLHKIDFVNFLHPLTKFLNVEFFIKFYKIIDKTHESIDIVDMQQIKLRCIKNEKMKHSFLTELAYEFEHD